MQYLDSVALARLKNIKFDLRRHLSEGHLTGRHRSTHRGFAQEFAQHKAYTPGDELKHLDWKVYARKDRFFIKEFQEEKSLKTYILMDASGSMGFKAKGPVSKWELGCRLAMAMSYLVLSQGDAAGLLTFDTEVRDSIAPRQNFSHLEQMDATLSKTQPAGETELGNMLARIVETIPRRSLIILISDLLGNYDKILETVRAFRARKHRILVLQTLDPMERDLDLEGPVLFVGMEDAGELRCEVSLVREAYHEAFERQQRLYLASFRGTGIFYDTFYTDVSWDKGLTRFLALQNTIG